MLNIASQPRSGEDGEDTRKTWSEMLIDSAIIGGIAVFAVIGSAPPTLETAWIAFKAFGGHQQGAGEDGSEHSTG